MRHFRPPSASAESHSFLIVHSIQEDNQVSRRQIESVAVLGGGTMGSGIAAACAQAGVRVALLDITAEQAEKGKSNMLKGRAPMLDDPASADLIATGSFDESLDLARSSDWICEAIVENLDAKRELFARLNAVRKPGSIVSTNTSGIPLRSIYQGMPEEFCRDVAVTHFFNPVKVMKLLELVPGEQTSADVIESLASFCGDRLGKGVVYAKDTVNFIGNRIGCFWMLAGIHKGARARTQGLSVEQIDALMAGVGIPSTGLYGLIDLIGLDVMDLVAKNLERNLPQDDAGRAYLDLPDSEQAMLASGQLGRKSGGGYYRMQFKDDGSRSKQLFVPEAGEWRNVDGVRAGEDDDVRSIVAREDAGGRFAWDLICETLCYAADLVPEISDDIVNIDRAMRWGFNWQKGPFEMFDALGPGDVKTRLESEGRAVPAMLAALLDSGLKTFYSDCGAQYFALDGRYCDMPS